MIHGKFICSIGHHIGIIRNNCITQLTSFARDALGSYYHQQYHPPLIGELVEAMHVLLSHVKSSVVHSMTGMCGDGQCSMLMALCHRGVSQSDQSHDRVRIQCHADTQQVQRL
eukprot:14153950-Ditylum_brightwellii.AAC.1